jgi:hypothetical protein
MPIFSKALVALGIAVARSLTVLLASRFMISLLIKDPGELEASIGESRRGRRAGL